MIDHVTYHVPPGTLERPDLEVFMMALGLQEINTDDPFEHGWNVRWFSTLEPGQPALHLVEGTHDVDTGVVTQDLLGLGHFCVRGLSPSRLRGLKKTTWIQRDSGSGRIWLGLGNLRVEVRP